jgi:hypothetical protein
MSYATQIIAEQATETNEVLQPVLPSSSPLTIEPIPVIDEGDEALPPPNEIDTSVNDQLMFPEYFWELASGGIWDGAPSGAVLVGDDDVGDIFFFDEAKNIAAYGYGGGDIFFANNASGKLYGGADGDIFVLQDFEGKIIAGQGGDIIDVVNFSGSISLGSDTEGDVVIFGGTGDGITHVTGFNSETDVFLMGVEAAVAEATGSGIDYTLDGRVFLTLSGNLDQFIL